MSSPFQFFGGHGLVASFFSLPTGTERLAFSTREVNELSRDFRAMDIGVDIRVSHWHIIDKARRSSLNLPQSSFLRLTSLLAGIVQSQAVGRALPADVLESRWAGELVLPGFFSGKGLSREFCGCWKGVEVICESIEMLIFIALFNRQSD
jgi:hypothetical protein